MSNQFFFDKKVLGKVLFYLKKMKTSVKSSKLILVRFRSFVIKDSQ